jgi:hypothetical protein
MTDQPNNVTKADLDAALGEIKAQIISARKSLKLVQGVIIGILIMIVVALNGCWPFN